MSERQDPVMCDALKELMRPEFEEELETELKNNTRDVTRDVTIANIKNLMSRMHWSARETMDALGIPEEKREGYARIIEETETMGNA